MDAETKNSKQPFSISVDPGARSIAWASFTGEELVWCDFLKGETLGKLSAILKSDFGHVKADNLIIEKPQIYQGRMQSGDPNDLIDVAIPVGMMVQSIEEIGHLKIVRPREWKGTRPKKICNALTLKALSPVELNGFESRKFKKGEAHNVLDAIGIGLWHLGRR